MTTDSDLQRAIGFFEQQDIPRQFSINDTRFMMNKLPPMDGYRVWEPYRVEVFDRIQSIELEANTKSVVALAGLLLGVSEPVQERARQEMFKEITFQNETAVTPMVLAGNENIAFQGMEVAHVYEVFLRAFALNFMGSLRAIVSRIAQVRETLLPPPTTT